LKYKALLNKTAIMTRSNSSRQHTVGALFRPLISGILGIALMLPAVVFLFTLLARLFLGTRTPYYFIAPSFLQSPFDLFAFHKAQFIIGSLTIAAVCNLPYRRSWLNNAVTLQSVLLLLMLSAYTFIQHLRY
jgi:hypothetical protein